MAPFFLNSWECCGDVSDGRGRRGDTREGVERVEVVIGVESAGVAITWRVARDGGGGAGERVREVDGESGGLAPDGDRLPSGVDAMAGDNASETDGEESSTVLGYVERVVEVLRLELLWPEDVCGGEFASSRVLATSERARSRPAAGVDGVRSSRLLKKPDERYCIGVAN